MFISWNSDRQIIWLKKLNDQIDLLCENKKKKINIYFGLSFEFPKQHKSDK